MLISEEELAMLKKNAFTSILSGQQPILVGILNECVVEIWSYHDDAEYILDPWDTMVDLNTYEDMADYSLFNESYTTLDGVISAVDNIFLTLESFETYILNAHDTTEVEDTLASMKDLEENLQYKYIWI